MAKGKMHKTVVTCKVLFIGLCMVLVLDGHHPPLKAQAPLGAEASRSQTGVAIAIAVEEKGLADLQATQERQEKKLDDNAAATAVNANAISGIQGEERGIGALLVLMQLLSMVFTHRRSKAAAGV